MIMQRGENADEVVIQKPMKTVNISNSSIKVTHSYRENKADVNKEFKISSSKHFNFSQVGGARKMLGTFASNTPLKSRKLTQSTTLLFRI